MKLTIPGRAEPAGDNSPPRSPHGPSPPPAKRQRLVPDAPASAEVALAQYEEQLWKAGARRARPPQ